MNHLPRLSRIYPLLACVYSALHLAASNSSEWVRLSDLQTPWVISTVVTAVLWIVAACLTRDPDKRSFLTFLGVVTFVGGRSADDGLMVLLPFIRSDPTSFTPLVLAPLGLCAIVGTVYSRRSFAPTTRFLSVVSAVLVTFPIVQIALARSWQAAVSPAAAAVATETPEASEASVESRPTIYLIVLDKYQGSASLRSYYGFDNAPFEHALRDRGFVVPRRPRANYTHTRQAMNALVNWEYLDSLSAVVGQDETDLTPLFQRVENNRAIALLKGLGYEFIFFPNSYEPFRQNRHADLQLPDPEKIQPELETVWVETTMMVPLARVLCGVAPCVYVPGVPESAALTDWKFDQLAPLAASHRPRFVLAHLLVPHEPYVYRSDCRHIPPSLVWRDSAATRAAYLEQIRCVNDKVLTAVDGILRASPTPPIILLQSDHGNGHVPRDDFRLEEARPDMVRARVDIFAAYYVPGAADSLFYGGMTPVNLLPRVFNHLFGTTFPRQPDRSFWVVDGVPYGMTPIPNETLIGTD